MWVIAPTRQRAPRIAGGVGVPRDLPGVSATDIGFVGPRADGPDRLGMDRRVIAADGEPGPRHEPIELVGFHQAPAVQRHLAQHRNDGRHGRRGRWARSG